MLVLSRKENESVIIADNIKIVIVEIRGDKVRLGIDAPRDVSVHRKEIYDAIAAGESPRSEPMPVIVPVNGVPTIATLKGIKVGRWPQVKTPHHPMDRHC